MFRLLCVLILIMPMYGQCKVSELHDLQFRFSLCVSKLIQYAYDQGYTISLGDAYRSPSVSYGHPKSTHRSRLAIDLNLFKDGEYIRDDKGHKELGKFWVKCDKEARWGGTFNDPNHYSFTYGGVS